jgi:hypothetical protein
LVGGITLRSMSEFRLLMPHEVIDRWESLRGFLAPAVEYAGGELAVDDIRSMVLAGRMFVFADDAFAVTCQFEQYPRSTAMFVGFGGGKVPERGDVAEKLTAFAHKGGAASVRTYCKNPAMTRYYRRWFGLTPTYTVLEKQL